MNKKEILRLLKITIVMGIIIFYLLIYFLNQGTVNNVGAIRYISITMSIIIAFWLLYFWILWRTPILKYVIFKPYIGGVWIGYGNSDYIIDNKKVPEFKIALIIRQSFLTTKITGCSKTFHSNSYIENFAVKSDKSKRMLVYLYESNRSTSIEEDLGGRSGASELQVFLGKKKILSGDYWTKGGSTGFIRVYKKNKGIFDKIETFDDVENKWENESHWIT